MWDLAVSPIQCRADICLCLPAVLLLPLASPCLHAVKHIVFVENATIDWHFTTRLTIRQHVPSSGSLIYTCMAPAFHTVPISCLARAQDLGMTDRSIAIIIHILPAHTFDYLDQLEAALKHIPYVRAGIDHRPQKIKRLDQALTGGCRSLFCACGKIFKNKQALSKQGITEKATYAPDKRMFRGHHSLSRASRSTSHRKEIFGWRTSRLFCNTCCVY